MRAMDVMVRDVVTAKPDDAVADAIKLLIKHDVSALPVVDDAGHVIGVISEADLVHREEIGTEKHRPWWLEALVPASTLAAEFAKSHGWRVAEVMSTKVVSASRRKSPRSATSPRCSKSIGSSASRSSATASWSGS